MSSDPDENFFRDYFASYEAMPSGSVPSNVTPLSSMDDLEYCSCTLKCCVRFAPKIRLMLRAWYQRLTPEGRTAFLNAHLREPSPGSIQYRLPTMGAGDPVMVCTVHFMNTLQESKDRVVGVISAKRMVVGMEEDDEEDFEGFDEVEIQPEGMCKVNWTVRLDRRARGLSYTTRTNTLKPPRKVKAPCDTTCKFKCYRRFPLADRQQRLKNLLQMPLVKQRTFLTDLVCKISVMPPRKPRYRSRLHNYYFFREGRQLHRVCKTMFLNTYDITSKQFSNMMKKMGSNGHVVCGNPEIANVLKNLTTRRLVFDVDEGLALEQFPIDLGSVKLEEVLLEDVHDKISFELVEIKSEFDEIEQAILPDISPLSNTKEPNEKILSNYSSTASPKHAIEENFTQDIELACVDIKSETDEPQENQQQLVESDIDPDDFATDSQIEVASTYEELPSEINLKNLMHDRKIRGLSYTSTTGKQYPARQIKPHCGTSCHMQCYTRVSDEVRQELLVDLLRLPHSKQIAFIGDHICRTSAIRPRTKISRRQCTNFYFLPVDSRLVKVCKPMFCSTYDLTDRKIRRIMLKKGANKHVVCGNSNFPSILKKGSAGYYFDYNAGCDSAEEDTCKCHQQCSSKFSVEVIEGIRSSFQEKSTEEQYEFLSKYVQLMTGDKSPLFRARFFLPLEPTTTQEVCRKMFLTTFQVQTSYLLILLNDVEPTVDPIEYATAHIASYQMDEDHQCEVAADGAVRKLSRCPNPVRMYNEYVEGLGPEAIDYQQYHGMFSKRYAQTGLMLPTRCPDCGYFDRGDGV